MQGEASMAEQQRRLMTRAEVAELLGVPEKTLRNWSSQRRGPHSFHVGKTVRYRAQEVDRWLAAQEAAAPRGAA